MGEAVKWWAAGRMPGSSLRAQAGPRGSPGCRDARGEKLATRGCGRVLVEAAVAGLVTRDGILAFSDPGTSPAGSVQWPRRPIRCGAGRAVEGRSGGWVDLELPALPCTSPVMCSAGFKFDLLEALP